MKKFLSIVLTIAMILSTMSVVAFAEYGTTYQVATEEDLVAAFQSAIDGDAIVFSDVTLYGAYETAAAVTLIGGKVTLCDGASFIAPNSKPIETKNGDKIDYTYASFASEAGAEITVNAPAASLTAGGDLTFIGENVLGGFSAGYYNRTITISEGNSLEVNGTGRVTISYGNIFNITGEIEDAKTADKAAIKPSFKVAAGLSFNGSGTGMQFNATNAYIVSGNNDTSKNSGATDEFNFNFFNSIYDVAGKFCLSVPTSGKTPTFNMNFTNSVMNVKSHTVFAAPLGNIVLDNSVINAGSSMRNSGILNITNGSSVNVANMIQYGENGGNDGTIIVDNADLVIKGYIVDGQGNGEFVIMNNGSADISSVKDSTITIDTTASLTTKEVTGNSEIFVDLSNVGVGEGSVAPSLNITNDANLSAIVKPADGSSDVVINPDGTIDYKVYAYAVAGQGGFDTLQEAVNAATGDAVITVNVDEVTEDVTISQKEGVNITINGNDAAFTGTITIHGNARYNGAETLAINGFNFTTDEQTHDFIYAYSTGSVERYAHNVTVEDCSFTTTNTADDKGVVAMRFRQAFNINVVNCTFANLHSAMQTTGGDGIAIDGIATENCKNGVSFGTTNNVVVENSEINSEDGYGIRADGSGAYSLVIEDTTVEATYPVIIRKATSSDYSLDIKGESSFTAENDEGYSVVITSGADDEEFVEPENDIQVKVEETSDIGTGVFSSHEASVNGVYHKTIASAIEAANADDVVVVYPGTYDAFPAITKSVVITGDPNYGKASLFANTSSIEKPVINISDVTDGGVKYQAADITFDNVVFNVKDDAVMGSGYYACALGFLVEDVKNRNGLTVTNCDFINNSNMGLIAIMDHNADYTVVNNTFKNFDTVIYTAADNGKIGNVTVADNTFENVRDFYNGYWGVANPSSTLKITNNKAADNGTTRINVYDYAKQSNVAVTAFGSVKIENNDATVVLINYDEGAYETSVSGNDEVVYNYVSDDFMRKVNLPEGIVYVGYGSADEVKYLVENENVSTLTGVELVFVKNTDAEYADELSNSVWDIVLKTEDDEFINRLNSADFTFELTSVADMDYEIIATNDEVKINNVNNDDNRYEFHYDGKAGVTTDTAKSIRIGTVKFTGYNEFTFGVKAVETNAVHATTKFDNIVDSYTVANNKLVVNVDNDNDEDGVIESEIDVPTEKLTIVVDFPNAVEGNEYDYQKMLVKVSGEDIDTIEYELGTDVALVDGKYTIEVEDALTLNTSYAVEVSGEGYRTARYTVTMTDAKVLNFWNNVKDVAFEVEEGKSASAKNVTFLAGDIVKDANINIYDLSAVVSYFGTIDLKTNVNADKYIKYDLNRDGKIDSKDVAYVLVSWGK